MRLVDFVIMMLEAHAWTLQRLAGVLGEERLIELLEIAGDSPGVDWRPPLPSLVLSGFKPAFEHPSPLAEIELAVSHMNLTPVIEFFLWSYPPYRTIIESPLELGAMIECKGFATATNEVLASAQKWLELVGLPPDAAPEAQEQALTPWIRFRTSAYKKMKINPFSKV